MQIFDLEYDLIIEYFLIGISSSVHRPLCSNVYYESIDISCSSNFHFDELYLKSTQYGKVSHGKEDDAVIIEQISYNLGNLFGDVETYDETIYSNNSILLIMILLKQLMPVVFIRMLT